MGSTPKEASRRTNIIDTANRCRKWKRLAPNTSASEVRGSVFAYYLDDHHNDGLVVAAVKASPAVQALIEEASDQPPPDIANRGWESFALDGRSVDWEEVEGLVQRAYRQVAPKRWGWCRSAEHRARV